MHWQHNSLSGNEKKKSRQVKAAHKGWRLHLQNREWRKRSWKDGKCDRFLIFNRQKHSRQISEATFLNLSKLMDHHRVFIYNLWLRLCCEESRNGPLCKVVHFKDFKMRLQRASTPMSDLFTSSHSLTQTHKTPQGLTSLHWLTFHHVRRGDEIVSPHLLDFCFFYFLFIYFFKEKPPSSLPGFSFCLPAQTQLSHPSNFLHRGAFIKLLSPFISIFSYGCFNVLAGVCMCAGMSWQVCFSATRLTRTCPTSPIGPEFVYIIYTQTYIDEYLKIQIYFYIWTQKQKHTFYHCGSESNKKGKMTRCFINYSAPFLLY